MSIHFSLFLPCSYISFDNPHYVLYLISNFYIRCFLFLLTYSKAKPDIAIRGISVLVKDLLDPSPLIRALSLRTMAAIPVQEFFDAILIRISDLLQDPDPYVCKTAAYGVAKLWNHDHKSVEDRGLISELNNLLSHNNPTVIAGALAALSDITEKSNDLELTIDTNHAVNFVHALADCNEWSQSYILSALMNYVPQTHKDAIVMIEKVLPRLQHANSSVVLTTVRLIVYLINYIPDFEKEIPHMEKRITPAFVILLAKPPEIQYLALRNCIILLQSRPNLLKLDVKDFLTKYNDPIYIKATKLEIIFLLANEHNIDVVLRELRECATEIDVQIAHKSVRAIGKLAVKIDSAADACVEELMELVSTQITYIIQEATIVLKNIFRKYPRKYEKYIPVLCENIDSLDEPEAKAAMIWILGNYSQTIDNADELLDTFLETYKEDTVEVQLALLTAIVKLFIYKPQKGQHLVPKVLGWATEESDNPDVRDRGYMYWRLLSADPSAAKNIVAGPMPIIDSDSDRMSDETLEELELNIGTLATIYLKPVKQVFRLAKVRQLADSPALAPRMRRPVLSTRQSTPNLLTRSSTFGTTQTSQPGSQGITSVLPPKPLSRSQSLSVSMSNVSLGRANTLSAPTTMRSGRLNGFHPTPIPENMVASQPPPLPASSGQMIQAHQQATTANTPLQPQQTTAFQQQLQHQEYTNNSEHLGSLLLDHPQHHDPMSNSMPSIGHAATMPMFQPDTPGSGYSSFGGIHANNGSESNLYFMHQNNGSGYFSGSHGLSSSAAATPSGSFVAAGTRGQGTPTAAAFGQQYSQGHATAGFAASAAATGVPAAQLSSPAGRPLLATNQGAATFPQQQEQ